MLRVPHLSTSDFSLRCNYHSSPQGGDALLFSGRGIFLKEVKKKKVVARIIHGYLSRSGKGHYGGEIRRV